MTHSDTKYIWGLTNVHGLGPKRVRAITDYLDSKRVSLETFWKDPSNLLESVPIPVSAKNSLMEYWQKVDIDEHWGRIIEGDYEVISFVDGRYPQTLLMFDTAPSILYVKGDIDLLHTVCVAVVGTRKISPYGELATKYFTQELIKNGYTIISGFMYGVDVVSHQEAINYGGKTIGVLGYGFNFMYPQSQQKLFQTILDKGGCFITEFPPDIEPKATNFPLRNRIVAGLSQGVLVTEAAAESGSRITAQCAVDMGKEVFAVPGPFTSPFSEGTKELINMGAKLVTNGNDIVEELLLKNDANNQTVSAGNQTNIFDTLVSEDEQKVLNILQFGEKEGDELATCLQLMLSTLLPTLSMMEMKGMITQSRGKYWMAKLYSH